MLFWFICGCLRNSWISCARVDALVLTHKMRWQITQSFALNNRWLKSPFNIYDCCLATSLPPLWKIISPVRCSCISIGQYFFCYIKSCHVAADYRSLILYHDKNGESHSEQNFWHIFRFVCHFTGEPFRTWLIPFVDVWSWILPCRFPLKCSKPVLQWNSCDSGLIADVAYCGCSLLLFPGWFCGWRGIFLQHWPGCFI